MKRRSRTMQKYRFKGARSNIEAEVMAREAAKKAFNWISWVSDYWDGDHISFSRWPLEGALREFMAYHFRNWKHK